MTSVVVEPHPLSTAHTFWLMNRSKARPKNEEGGANDLDYEKAIKKVATFSTVEEFWQIYGHMTRPHEPSIDYHLFRQGVKPVWEDPANRRGGKLVIKCRKGLGARYFEAAMLAFIGEQFGDLSGEIMGIVLSVRNGEDALAVWTRNADDQEATERIREVLKKSTRVPAFVPIEFKRHEINVSGPANPVHAPPVWRQKRDDRGAAAVEGQWR